jgi:peptide/nickel transport system substrate-binding protein
MPFEPYVGQELVIDGLTYRVAEHPAAPGMVYGQEGRRAIVYQLIAADGGHQALKVFKPRFRVPRMVAAAERLEAYARLPGLQACRRTILTASRHLALLREHRDLAYAVLMPWVEGATWQEIILSQEEFSPDRALSVARSLAQVLMTMEERGLAHCDLSGPNLIVEPGDQVALVDLEEMYGPGFMQPEALPAGSPGYAHKSAPLGLWQAQADRFAGAVLLAEMLGWCDPKVRAAAWGESYFPPAEMQDEGERYQTLHASVAGRWGRRTTDLFAQAWRSDSLLDCPTFAEWAVALPEGAPEMLKEPEPAPAAEPAVSVALLVLSAETAADTGSWDQALALYRQALEAAPPELTGEITARIARVEARRSAAAAERPPPLVKPRAVEAPRWDCPHCGRAVGGDVEVCPYCEQGHRDKTVVRPRPLPTWRCPNCGRQAPGGADVCPHCERGRRDGTVVSPRTQVRAEAVTPAKPEPAAAPPRAAPMSRFVRWAPVLILGAGYGVGWYVDWYAIGLGQGPIVGLVTGLILSWTERSLRGRHVALLTLGWAVAWLVGSCFHMSPGAIVAGAVGGLITGLILRKRGSLPGWRQLIWVVGGYAVAWWLAWRVSYQFYRAVDGMMMSLPEFALTSIPFGWLAGAVGGGVLYWQLGRLTGRAITVPAEAEPRQPPAPLPEPRQRRVPCLVWILAAIGALLIGFLLLYQLGFLDHIMELALPGPAAEAPEMPTEAPDEPTRAPQPTEVPEVELLTVRYPCEGHFVREIAAVDELTVRFSLCEPEPNLASIVAYPVLPVQPRECVEEMEGAGEPIECAVGTGPYYLGDWDQGDAIAFRRFDDYWGQPAEAERLIFVWAEEADTRLQALRSGEVDLIRYDPPEEKIMVECMPGIVGTMLYHPSEHYAAVQRDPDLQLLVAPGLDIMYLGMNNTFAPWDDVRVRQAIAVGIDRQRIVEDYYPVGSEVASHYTPCAVPNGCAGEEWYSFDPELGRALLAEAGYPDGFQTSLFYVSQAEAHLPEPCRVAADLQAQLRDNLGVEAELIPMDTSTFYDEILGGRLDGLHLEGDWFDGLALSAGEYLDSRFGRFYHWFGEPHAAIYEALEEAATLSAQEAASLYAQANDAIREMVPMVPITHGAGPVYAARADVEGVYVPAWGAPHFWQMDPGGREELVYMTAYEPPNLYCAGPGAYLSLEACSVIFETLLALDEEGHLQPRLAADWEVNGDATVWTFYLQPGVRFHDGSTLDASDVVKGWEVMVPAATPVAVE